jgi:dihydroceramidase
MILTEPSVVEWCEAHTDRYSLSPYISEMSNTISNSVFCLVALFSMWNYPKHISILFTQCDIALFIVGLGSAYFHASETFFGEITDEFPMSILMYYYISIACHIQRWRFPRFYYLGIMSLLWSFYLIYREYLIFIVLFISQLLIPVYITVRYIPKTPIQKKYLVFAFVSLLFGKICWICERYLHANGKCPQHTSPLFFLHSFWHLGAALAHYWIMRCWIQNNTHFVHFDNITI